MAIWLNHLSPSRQRVRPVGGCWILRRPRPAAQLLNRLVRPHLPHTRRRRKLSSAHASSSRRTLKFFKLKEKILDIPFSTLHPSRTSPAAAVPLGPLTLAWNKKKVSGLSMAFQKTTFPLSSATRLAKHRTFTNSEKKKNERNLQTKNVNPAWWVQKSFVHDQTKRVQKRGKNKNKNGQRLK